VSPGPRDRESAARPWGDQEADELFGTGRDASPQEVLDAVNHQLGIGTRRERYRDAPDLSDLREEMQL
jgi:hypothetical protein